MSIYRYPGGDVTVEICDGCGIAEDYTRPDLATLIKLDVVAEMLAADVVKDSAQTFAHFCPECQARLSPDQGRMAL